MEKKLNIFWRITSSWKFWLALYVILIASLTIIGIYRGGTFGGTIKFMIGKRGIEMPGDIATVIIPIIGFPYGVFNFTKINILNLFSGNLALFIFLTFIYYAFVILLIRHISKLKKYFKIFIIILLILFTMSFSGCAKDITFFFT